MSSEYRGANRDSDSASKVYIGGLSHETEKADIEAFVRGFSPSQQIWIARNPPGFAFVTFSTPEAAQSACRELDGRDINGRRVRVQIARPSRRRSAGEGGGYRRDRSPPPPMPQRHARRSSRSRSRDRDRGRDRDRDYKNRRRSSRSPPPLENRSNKRIRNGHAPSQPSRRSRSPPRHRRSSRSPAPRAPPKHSGREREPASRNSDPRRGREIKARAARTKAAQIDGWSGSRSGWNTSTSESQKPSREPQQLADTAVSHQKQGHSGGPANS